MNFAMVLGGAMMACAFADNCAAFHGLSMQTNLTNRFCVAALCDANVPDCGCTNCCEWSNTTGTCGYGASVNRTACSNASTELVELVGKTKDKQSGITSSTFQANCCKPKKSCSTFTCPAGWSDKANKATQLCEQTRARGGKYTYCAASTCCDSVAGTCRANSTTYSCDYSNTFTDITKYTLVPDNNTQDGYRGKCCTAKAACSAFTCPAGTQNKAAYATTYCSEFPGKCTWAECCDHAVATTCKYMSKDFKDLFGNMGDSVPCNSSASGFFFDLAKADTALTLTSTARFTSVSSADYATAAAACCSASATCQAFSTTSKATLEAINPKASKEASGGSSASGGLVGGSRQQASSFFIAVIIVSIWSFTA